MSRGRDRGTGEGDGGREKGEGGRGEMSNGRKGGGFLFGRGEGGECMQHGT